MAQVKFPSCNPRQDRRVDRSPPSTALCDILGEPQEKEISGEKKPESCGRQEVSERQGVRRETSLLPLRRITGRSTLPSSADAGGALALGKPLPLSPGVSSWRGGRRNQAIQAANTAPERQRRGTLQSPRPTSQEGGGPEQEPEPGTGLLTRRVARVSVPLTRGPDENEPKDEEET